MNRIEQKTEIARIRLTPRLMGYIKDEARERGETISAVIRWAIYERYHRIPTAQVDPESEVVRGLLNRLEQLE